MDFFNPIITFHPQNYYFILKTQKKKTKTCRKEYYFLISTDGLQEMQQNFRLRIKHYLPSLSYIHQILQRNDSFRIALSNLLETKLEALIIC